MKPIHLALVGTLLTASPALADTIWVESGGSIQDALNRAGSGDEVRVKPGIYNGGVVIPRNGVSLVSDTPGGAHIIEGGDNTPAIGSYGKSGVSVIGFQLSSLRGDGVKIGGSPGNNASGITFKNNTVRTAAKDGLKFFQIDHMDMTGNAILNAGTSRNANGDGGIDWVDVNNSTARDNHVQKTFGHACFMMKTGSRNNVIENNVLDGCERDGMTVGGFSGGRAADANDTGYEASDNTIRNNTISAGNGKCPFYFRRQTGNRIEGNKLVGGADGCPTDGGGGDGANLDTADGTDTSGTPTPVITPAPKPDLTPKGSSAANWTPSTIAPAINEMRRTVESRTTPPNC